MRRIVVDTNVAFSTFLNINSRIGQILLNGSRYYNFYAPDYIRYELIEHKEKIKSIGKLTDERYVELFALILRNIRTLNHSIIPKIFYQTAFEICKDIDEDDTAFIAINNYVRGRLWTGDVKLINGLLDKGYSKIITTSELYKDFTSKENRNKNTAGNRR
jgi:predicted nucleic acid-binding protein